MRNYRKHIDDFFREKLGGYTEAPPTEVWDDLEKRLDGLTTVTTPSPYRWLWHFAIVSLLLFFGVSVSRKLTNSNTTNNEIIQTDKTATNKAVAANTPSTTAPAANGAATGNAPTGNAAENSINGNTPNIATAATNGLNNNNPVNNNNASNSTPIAAGKTQRNSYSTKTQNPTNGHKQANRTTQQPNSTTNTYAANTSSKSSAHGPSADDANDNTPVNTSPNSTLSSASKNASATTEVKKDEVAAKKVAAAKPVAKAIVNKPIKKPVHSDFPRFEAGVKVGVEGGFSNGAATKLVVSPYVQYNLSKKFALMIQPAVKAAMLTNKNIGTSQQYYSLNEDGKITEDGDVITTHTVGGSVVDTHHTKYTYTQTRSVITKTNTFGGTYAEAELPVLLKYNINKKLSVYGGVNIVYTKLMGVTERTGTQQNVLATKDTTVVSVNSTTSPSQLPKNIITYTGTPISQYSGPAYPGTPTAQFRAGYMVGFSYNCSKKVMLDALMEQTPAPGDVKGGYNTNTPLSTPYFRLSVGYKIK